MELTVKVTANQRELAATILGDKVKATEDGKSIIITAADPTKLLDGALENLIAKGGEGGKTLPVLKGLRTKVDRVQVAAKVNAAPPAPRTVNKPYVNKERTRRGTGTKTRILYLLAQNRPADAIKPVKGEDGKDLVFAAECITHNVHTHYLTYAAAYAAAKVSPEWCTKCGPAAAEHAAAKKAAAEAKAKAATVTATREKGAAKPAAKATTTRRRAAKPAAKGAEKAKA